MTGDDDEDVGDEDEDGRFFGGGLNDEQQVSRPRSFERDSC